MAENPPALATVEAPQPDAATVVQPTEQPTPTPAFVPRTVACTLCGSHATTTSLPTDEHHEVVDCPTCGLVVRPVRLG
jgi:hypothetical protein